MDLGFSKDVSKGDGITSTRIGTPITMAPELLRGDKTYNAYQADVYSLGVIFFYLLYGKYPYEANTPAALLNKINDKFELDVKLDSKPIDKDI